MAIRYDIPTVTADIVVRKGSTLAIVLTFTSAGVAIDLTGYTIRGEIRQTFTSIAAALAMAGDATDAATGVMRLNANVAAVAAMPGGTYANASTREDPGYGFWEAELVDNSIPANIYRVAEGKVRMSRQASLDA